MSDKKTTVLPAVRCDEVTKQRVQSVAAAIDVTVTEFIYQAIEEKLARMETEWRALNAVFSPTEE